MVRVRGQIFHNLGSRDRTPVTLDGGGLATDWAVYDEPAGRQLPPLEMEPHSEKGVEAASIGKRTMADVARSPAWYAMPAPPSAAGDVNAYWGRVRGSIDRIWVPGSVVDQPAGFKPRSELLPNGLAPQSPTLVTDAVQGAEAVVPGALAPCLPHAGSSKALREQHIDPSDCPTVAIFECHDRAGADPYPALAVVVSVAAGPAGESQYECRWYTDPAADGRAEFESHAGGEMIGAPLYRLTTADDSLNHGANWSSNGWNRRSKACLKLPKSAMAIWKTIEEEVAMRANPTAGVLPPPPPSEYESRARAAAQARRRSAVQGSN